MQLCYNNLRVRGGFLMISFLWRLSRYFFSFLYLVDLVLQLNLLCVKSKHLIRGYFLFTRHFQFQSFYTWTDQVSCYLTFTVNRNQLFTTLIRLCFLPPVVVKEHLLDWIYTRFLLMDEITCPVFPYFDHTVFKSNCQMHLTIDFVIYAN